MSAAGAKINVAVLGGTGYGAGELLRLFTQHAHVRVIAVTTTSQPGDAIEHMHPHLRGFYDGLKFQTTLPWEHLLDGDRAIIFSALPSGVSGGAAARIAEETEKRGVCERVGIIDLSGDLRLKDGVQHAQHYPESPALAGLRSKAVYGLTELNRAVLKEARLVANPGCLATAAILAAAPLVQLGVVGTLAVDAKTGSSGSGRQLKETTHHPTRRSDFRAYKPLSHQHEPEILQALGDPRGERVQLSFVAQSMDTTRGIFVTVHATLGAPVSRVELLARYEAFYADSPFVRVVEGSPTLQGVVGSNFCDVAIAVRDRQVIAMAALDNLVKGMSGAAIQNMNVMCGLDEKTGLWTPSLRPV